MFFSNPVKIIQNENQISYLEPSGFLFSERGKYTYIKKNNNILNKIYRYGFFSFEFVVVI